MNIYSQNCEYFASIFIIPQCAQKTAGLNDLPFFLFSYVLWFHPLFKQALLFPLIFWEDHIITACSDNIMSID